MVFCRRNLYNATDRLECLVVKSINDINETSSKDEKIYNPSFLIRLAVLEYVWMVYMG